MKLKSTLAALTAGLALTAGATAAFAQAYPSKPITLNSSLAPGSSYDVILRTIQDDWQQRLGKTLVINPVVGALGTLAPASLKRAENDGYTIAFVFAAPMTLSPAMMAPPPYDPNKDFAPVIQLTRHGFIFAANPKFPANNFNEFIAVAKAKPRGVTVAHAGAGGQVHLLQIAAATGVEFLNVPYKNSVQMAPAVMSGEVDLVIHTVGAVAELIKANRLKGLFIAQPNRTPQLPNVPTLAETRPGLEGGSWFGIVAPAGTPKDRVDWLNREFAAGMKLPAAQASATASAYEIVAGTPQQFADVIRNEFEVNQKIVKQYGVKAD